MGNQCQVTPVDVNEFEDNKTYYINIKAKNQAGLETIKSSAPITVDLDPPDQVEAIAFPGVQDGGIIQCLASASDQDGTPIHKFRYQVLEYIEGADNNCDSVVADKWIEVVATSSQVLDYQVNNDDFFKKYYFCVQAQNKTEHNWSASVPSSFLKYCRAYMKSQALVEDFNTSNHQDVSGVYNNWLSGFSQDKWTTLNSSGVRPQTDLNDDDYGSGGINYGLDTPKDNYLVNGDATWHDYIFTASYWNLDNDAAGFVVRRLDKDNFYLIYQTRQYGPPDDPNKGKVTFLGSKLIKVKNGVPQLLATSPITYTQGTQFQKTKIFANGNRLTAWFDNNGNNVFETNEMLFDIIDSEDPILSGQMGPYSYENGSAEYAYCHFDNFNVDRFVGYADVKIDGNQHPREWFMNSKRYVGTYTLRLLEGKNPLILNCEEAGYIYINSCGEPDYSNLINDPELIEVDQENDTVTLLAKIKDKTNCQPLVASDKAVSSDPLQELKDIFQSFNPKRDRDGSSGSKVSTDLQFDGQPKVSKVGFIFTPFRKNQNFSTSGSRVWSWRDGKDRQLKPNQFLILKIKPKLPVIKPPIMKLKTYPLERLTLPVIKK